MAEPKRIQWIDGIKGVSCIFILIHHYFLFKFPSSYYGSAKESLCNGIDTFFSQSVLSFFMTGNFYVHLYILITGYVTAFQICRMQDNLEKFLPFAFKRYMKLAFPLLVFCLLMWIGSFILSALAFDSNTFFNALKCGLFKILFHGNGDYGNHFWMLNIIFLGGFAVSLFSVCSFNFSTRKMIRLSALVVFILVMQKTITGMLFASCFNGALLFFLVKEMEDIEIKHRTIVFTILLLLGIFFGAYPSGVKPDNYYRFFILPVESNLSSMFWHFIGAFLVFLSVSQLNALQRVFELKGVVKMAKYSYSFYILHLVVIEFLLRVINKIVKVYEVNEILISLMGLPFAIVITLAASYVFENLFVLKFNRKINTLYSVSSEKKVQQ